jgi:hypothetical protein
MTKIARFSLNLAIFYLAILRSILLIRVLFFPSTLEATAQSAAGNQPMMVIWRIKHKMPLSIFPLKKKDNQGTKTAINNIAFSFFVAIYNQRFSAENTFLRMVNTSYEFLRIIYESIHKRMLQKNKTITNLLIAFKHAKRYFPSHSLTNKKIHHSLESLTNHDT